MTARNDEGNKRIVGGRARMAWAMYDWAGNGFATVIISFVFSAYFARNVAADETTGTSQWGTALAISGVAAALSAPIAGAIADRGGPVKPWLLSVTLLCAGATAGLWYVEPEIASVTLALVLVAVGSFGIELAMVFYNSMLPRLVPPERLGRLSGRAWALGYAGGLTCLAVALFVFVRGDVSLFDFDRDRSEGVRAVGPLVGSWLIAFSAPLFLFTPDRARSGLRLREAVREGFSQIYETLAALRSYRDLIWFLVARLIYIDGVGTIFAFGGIYAAGTFDLSVEEVIILGIALNVSAGLGAFAGSWIDDRLGAKPTILIGLLGIVLCGAPLIVVDDAVLLWIFAMALGLFVGPVQASSRSLMARLSPRGMETQMFGFFTASGKITAFLGPALVAWVTSLAESQRAGMSVIILFFVVGALILTRVREPARPNR
jgi:UMF1 family MFS transporter